MKKKIYAVSQCTAILSLISVPVAIIMAIWDCDLRIVNQILETGFVGIIAGTGFMAFSAE